MTTNEEAVRSWERQDYTRKQSVHVSSQGPRLISCSTPVAYLDDAKKVLFVSDNTYSVTAARKHMTHIRMPHGYTYITPREVLYLTPEKMLISAAALELEHLLKLTKANVGLRERVGYYHSKRHDIIHAASLYGCSIPELPYIHIENLLLTDNKTIKLTIKGALEDVNANI